MFWNYLIVAIGFGLAGCVTKQPTTADNRVNEIASTSAKNTIAKGVLLSKKMDDRYSENANHPCAKLPCIGEVQITEVIQPGMDYHGQFSVGDTITAFFTYTLGNSSEFFPAKQPAPNSVELQSVIQITIAIKPNNTITVIDHKAA